MITARQIRAARALLGWSQPDLAKLADVQALTIKRIEKNGMENTRAATAEAIENAFATAGIVFVDDHSKEGAAILKAKIKAKPKKK